jgi:hypothetical protein
LPRAIQQHASGDTRCYVAEAGNTGEPSAWDAQSLGRKLIRGHEMAALGMGQPIDEMPLAVRQGMALKEFTRNSV